MFLFTCLHLLAFWVFVMKITSAGECSENRVFDLIDRNSAASEVPSTERSHISEVDCARQCTTLYSDNCMGFFYNTNTSSCSIYNSSVNCVTLKDQPGTEGYAYVKQPPKLFECVERSMPYGDEIRPLNISGINEKVLGYYDSEGWLVIQRRTDGSEDFNRSWVEYENGFGNLRNEFWLGNKYIHALTSQRNHVLRIDLEDETGLTGYIESPIFLISEAAEKYMIFFGGTMTGNISNYLPHLSGRQFSTYDEDHDEERSTNCALQFSGGWWYSGCGPFFLNGWKPCFFDYCNRWTTFSNDLTRTQMKIRPT